jgi:NEDD4-binding protein 2
MRGLPGSGKSTKAKALAGEEGLIFSTDDFFMVNGKYEYDAKMIGDYHTKNI